MIGIWGPPGIGKTTIARFLFNRQFNNFELSVFMENIKTMYPIPISSDDYNAKLHLQQKFLSQIINQMDIKIPHLGVAQERLKNKKVLVVLDDVDRLVQLDAMAKETWWFGHGSRIIITTQVLKILKVHEIKNIYKMDFPPSNEALQIFCMYAFKQKSPKFGFEKLSWEVIELSGKLPLGLRVMGSYFRGLSKQEWEKALPRLRTHLDGEIESILKFSYNALSDDDKDLFLHIACFFNYEEIEKVQEHLSKRFLDVRQGLDVLVEKSLIYMEIGRVRMHDLLAQLGRNIVRKQSIREPEQRQFLVDRREIGEVLVDYITGSKSVIGIDFSFDETKDELNISERAFEGMSNLQFLRLKGSQYHTLYMSHGLNYISPKLRLLDWEYFPMTCLHFIVNTEFLVELIMCYSKLEKLWEGIKPLRNLKWMDLSYSVNLNELCDLSTATNLQELNLRGCSSLLKLPSSIGNAISLQKLHLNHCSSLVELPSSIGNAINLQNLNLSYCSSLVELPSSIKNATNLQDLVLIGCSSLVKLPSSNENAIINVDILDINGCSSLVEIPSSFGNAIIYLDILDFNGCSSLVKIPSSIRYAIHLKRLVFSGCSSLVELPSFIGNLHELGFLTMEGCSKLEVLPVNINLKSLELLDLTDCMSLKRFPEISTNIKYLQLNGTSIQEVPSSIMSWCHLEELHMPYSENLREFPHALDIITELHLRSDTGIQELGSWVKRFSRLRTLVLNGCKELLALSQLPDSLSKVDAEDCESLETLNCSFLNPKIHLNFIDCFKLNKEARDVIIKTSTCKVMVLPGGEIPTYFTYRANVGGSLIVKLNERHFSSSVIFKACILLDIKNHDVEADHDGQREHVFCWIQVKQDNILVPCNPDYYTISRPLTEHLYIFEFEVDVASDELFFELQVLHDKWDIKECGVVEVNTKKRMWFYGDCEAEEEEVNEGDSAKTKKRKQTNENS